MYWILRRSRRYSRPLTSARSTGPKLIIPAVAFSSPTMSLPIVVLPQPDSPTSPNGSPRRMSKLTLATALTAPTRRPAPPLQDAAGHREVFDQILRGEHDLTRDPGELVGGDLGSRGGGRRGGRAVSAPLRFANWVEASEGVPHGFPAQLRLLL